MFVARFADIDLRRTIRLPLAQHHTSNTREATPCPMCWPSIRAPHPRARSCSAATSRSPRPRSRNSRSIFRRNSLMPLMLTEPHATSRGVAPTFCDVSRHTLMLVDLTKPIRSVRHQCRFGHRGKHTTCRPAKNKFPQPGMPVPAHDNEIGTCIGCI